MQCVQRHADRSLQNYMEAYFDNSATTRCLDSVTDIMVDAMRYQYGNPSSMHRKGLEAERYIRYSKEILHKS